MSYFEKMMVIADADNDGENEIILATGKGDRTKPGRSFVIFIKNK